MTTEMPTPDADLRAAAITRLRKKREFYQHLVAYAVINLSLVAIWLLTTPGGFFWPVFPLLGWGIGIIFHALDTFAPASPSEKRIQREMRRLAH